MAEPDGDRDPLEALAAEFVARQRKGEYPSISEYMARHPELADQIQELFPAVAMLEQLKVHKQETSGPRAVWGSLGLERLGDFRILGEIGRGGMGIVYEAFQESLGRHVAVKVLPRQSLLDPRQLQRFQREAQTAARLHHTNIVPLFGVGEQEGFHYIVMQLIRGVGLDAVLDRIRQLGDATADRSIPHDGSPCASRAPSSEEAIRLAVSLVDGRFEQPRDTGPSPSTASRGGTTAGLQPASSDAPSCTEEYGAEADAPAGRKAVASSDKGRAIPPPEQLRMGMPYWRSVADIGRQVADALQYAHMHQTLHRDIKPANLLLDSQGVVWVTDFGLAKALDDAPQSHAGTIAGTLRYMAPEQFSGQLDCRSDVYSLGLTLYELATLQPAFADTHRSNLIHRISHAEPTRPRKLNPRIPRDLETIVLKAIARDPADRYPTAGDLGRDLECFLEDRPIAARRLHVLEQLWRWSRRNRALASLAASTVLLLVLVAVVASWSYVQTRQANVEEARQRKRAEETSALALEALDNIFQQFAPDRTAPASSLVVVADAGEEVTVPVQPVLSTEAAALLEHMLAFYDRLAAQGEGDARLRRKAAEANCRVGDIRQRFGQYDKAESAYLQATRLYARLADAAPQDAELRTEIARIRNELGNVYSASNELEKGRESYQSALESLKEISAESKGSAGQQYELARTYYFLGRGPRQQSMLPPRPPDGPFGPRPEFGGFRFDLRGPHPGGPGPHDGRPDRGPPPPEFHPGPMGGHDRLPPPGPRDHGREPPPRLFQGEDPAEMLDKAITLLKKLVADHPGVPDYRHLLARCYREMPPPWFRGQSSRSPDTARQATEILEQLVKEYPNVPDYRYDLCETYAMLDARGPFEADSPRQDERKRSRETLEKALTVSEGLVAEHPNIPDYVASQVHIRVRLAHLLWKSNPDEAEANLRKARDLETELVQHFPRNSSYKFWMAIIQETMAGLLQERGKLAEARLAMEECVRLMEETVKSDPRERHAWWMLAHNYRNLADLLRRMGDEQAATEAVRKAEELRQSP